MEVRTGLRHPALTDEEAETLVKVNRWAYRLDMGLLHCCGIRLGWGAAVGVIPLWVYLLTILPAARLIENQCWGCY